MTTYKQRLNEKYGLDKDTEHTLRELKDLTGVPIKLYSSRRTFWVV